jgi:hypothetical protein
MKKLLVIGLLIALCLGVSPVLAATITTDKPDYAPEEIVTLSGAGFTPGDPVFITVTRPDGSTKPYLVEPFPVIPDTSGAFTATYQLDGIQGTYVVVAIDSTGVRTEMTFKDCVPPPVPEFPSIALPAGMIIGIIGLVTILRNRESEN